MKKRRYVLKPRAKIMIALFMISYFLFVFIKQEYIMREQRESIRCLEQQIEQVKEDNEELVRQLEYTDTEEYIEKVARERLGLVKKGDIIFIQENDR